MNTLFMNKVLLNQLTSEDLDALMENPKVVNKVRNHMLQDANDVVDGVLYPLKGIGYYFITCDKETSYICMEDPCEFLNSLLSSSYMPYVFSQGQLNKAQKIVSTYEKDGLSAYPTVTNLAHKYANILTDYFVITYYEDIYKRETTKAYMKSELWNMYPDGAYYLRDENSIYYLTKD